VIHLDTSALIDSLCGKKRSEPRLRGFIHARERVYITSLVLFEWRRGPRLPEELEDQEMLFPSDQAVSFGSTEALVAADLYKRLRRGRGREIDIAIAASAIAHEARLWTLNPQDFKDIPGLNLV
jgi:predicted nucleic acid-binding protein